MAVKMLPRDVADAFVKQYYTILNKCPENCHKFYGESSLLGWSELDGVMTPVTTLSAINDKILSSDYKNCFVEVNTVDAQASHDGGVIVAVTGSFIEKDEVTNIFFQTFFLAKQEKGFFVLNDILRVFDACGSITNVAANAPNVQSSVTGNVSDIPTPSPTKAADEKTGKIEEALDNAITEDTVAKSSSPPSSIASGDKVPPVLAPASNAKVPSIVEPDSNAKVPSVVEPDSNARVPSVVEPDSNAKVPSVVEPDSNAKAPLVVEPASNANVPPKITYASMVAKATQVTSPTTAKTTPKASASLGNGAPKAPSLDGFVPKALALSSKVATKLLTGGNGTPDTSAHADVRAIYIGRLPYDITKQGVVDVLKKFGPVRRQSDSVQIRKHKDGFCCGFVEFESADSARRAVEAHHVKFGEKEAYIAHKKSSYNRGGSRSPTRGGFQNGNENRPDSDKGRARGSQRSRSSGQGARQTSRDRLN